MKEDKEIQYRKLTLSNYVDFYDSFNSVSEMMEFFYSRKRPSVNTLFTPSDNKSSITAVIPTKSAQDLPFKELPRKLSKINVLWVESSGPFFNFSYAMNIGIRKALEMGSEFIMLTNDDILPMDDISNIDIIVKRMKEKYDIFIPQIYNSNLFISPVQSIYRQSFITAHYLKGNHKPKGDEIDKVMDIRMLVQNLGIYSNPYIMKYIILRENDPVLAGQSSILTRKVKEFALRGVNKLLIKINNVQPISIVKSSLLESENFDESFVNGGEDVDLSIRLSLRGARVGYLDERFHHYGGNSLGTNIERILKNTIPEILILGYKLKKYFPNY
jgi:GT2 family glycosyltransferase